VRDPKDSPGQGRQSCQARAHLPVTGPRPATAPRLSAPPALPARANAGAAAPQITPPPWITAAFLLRSTPPPPSPVLAWSCDAHRRRPHRSSPTGPPESTARRHHAHKHGQGGTDRFPRGHARHLAEELPHVPNAGFGPGQGTVPWSCAARSSFRPPRWPRAARSAQLRSLPCSSLLTDRLSGRTSRIAVRSLAPNRAKALNSCPAPALGQVARGRQPRDDHAHSRCVISVRPRRGAHARRYGRQAECGRLSQLRAALAFLPGEAVARAPISIDGSQMDPGRWLLWTAHVRGVGLH
jgi:hypothetical protein